MINQASIVALNQRWSVVFQGRNMHGSDKNQDSTLDIPETHILLTQTPNLIQFDEVYGVYATRDDNDEEMWENIHADKVTK